MSARDRWVFAFLVLAARLLEPTMAPAQDDGTVARSTSEVLKYLSGAKAGQVIRMKPGVYSHLVINGFHGDATLTSFDPGQPAVLTDLSINNSSGLTLTGLNLDNSSYPMNPVAPTNTLAFQVLNSQKITLSHLDVHGSPTGTLATDESGVLIRFSKYVTVEYSDFHNLHNGLEQADNKWLIVRANHFHHLRDDGLRGGGSSNVLVEGNHCDSNHPDGPADTDHPDCIQFWTSNTKQSAHDIVIINNTYDRGDGFPTQGIHIRDEVGSLPFQRVTVKGNIVKGALYNGIEVFGAQDVTISGNQVCQLKGQQSWIVARHTDRVTVTNNSAPRIAYIVSSNVKDAANIIDGKCTPSSDHARK